MQYLEDTDGNPIDDHMAASIREYARTIWADFYQQEIAPERWNSAAKRVRDEYAVKMENQWLVLCYCNNHWKSHVITTSNYPQWLKNRLQKSDELAQKRHKCHRQVIGATLEEPWDFFEEKLSEEDSDKQCVDDGRSWEG